MSRRRTVVVLGALLGVLLAGAFAFEGSALSRRLHRTYWGLSYQQYYAMRAKIKRQRDAIPGLEASPEVRATRPSPPALTHPSGRYEGPFEVSLDPPRAARYTLDGSRPDGRSEPMPRALRIDDTCVLKVRVERPDGSLGDPATAFYLVGEAPALPVVSLAIDPIHLDGRHSGIRRHPHGQGKRWERPAVTEYVDLDGQSRGRISVRVRLTGGNSRKYRRPSFRLIVEDHEPRTPDVWLPPFEERTPRQPEWLVRREETAAWLDRDEVSQRVAGEMGLVVVEQRPCLLYVNGERWGAYQLSERVNGEWLTREHGVVEPTLFTVKGSLRRPKPVSGDLKSWHRFFAWLDEDADLTRDEDYGRFAGAVDVEALIDYYVFELWSGNQDWPHNNFLMYRDERLDRRWRPIVWDLDGAFDERSHEEDRVAWSLRDAIRPDLKPFGGTDRPVWVEGTLLFRRMAVRGDLRARIAARAEELLRGPLSPAAVIEAIDARAAEMRPARPIEADLWNLPTAAERLRAYDDHWNELRAFARTRPAALRQQLRRHFR